MTNERPLRHSSSERNRRKALKLAEDLMDELKAIYADHAERRAALEYAIGRCERLVNRLEGEWEQLK